MIDVIIDGIYCKRCNDECKYIAEDKRVSQLIEDIEAEMIRIKSSEYWKQQYAEYLKMLN